jgi:hypothetical protein
MINLDAAVAQLPRSEYREEAVPLADELDRVLKKRGKGPRPLSEILPVVLAKLGVKPVRSPKSGEAILTWCLISRKTMSCSCKLLIIYPGVHDGCHSIFDKFVGSGRQCGSGYSNTGYSFSNLIRASSVVKRQRTFASVRFRCSSHVPTSDRKNATSSIRRSRH